MAEKLTPMQRAIARDQQNKVDVVFDGLVAHPPRARLPEKIFVEYFLPFFAGAVQASTEFPFIAQWISVAGSAVSEVDIIDYEGNVLFSVPAVMNTSFIRPERGERPYNNIRKEYEMRQANPAAMPNRFLTSTMDARLMESIDAEAFKHLETDRWRAIFERYNVPAPAGVSVIQGPAVLEDDDYVY